MDNKKNRLKNNLIIEEPLKVGIVLGKAIGRTA